MRAAARATPDQLGPAGPTSASAPVRRSHRQPPLAEAALLAEAAVLLWLIRWALGCLRAGAALSLTRAVARLAARPSSARPGPAPELLARTVFVAARWMGVTCLHRSLATYAVLARRGYPACVRIGVARLPEEGLRAHAWVEVGGVPIDAPGEGAWSRALPPLLGPARP